ncbi:MAG: hypothetical protein CMJ06_00135 [Pelagibacterales bacterium]|nr:hypothetical protein [Pelagibacterales bacterium]|tara:strand:+ start:1205 stop:1387 length:183 start_codon:yes stop_codon:yes gene_type:complete
MFNIILKNALKNIAVKLATDKNLRNKLKNGVSKAQQLKTEGKLMKSLGKAAGRIKNKIKK